MQSEKLKAALSARITNYLRNGGLFNPEHMEHNKVRDLLIDCRVVLASPSPAPSEPLREAAQAFINHVTENGALDDAVPFAGDCIGLASWVGGCGECMDLFEKMRRAALDSTKASEPAPGKEKA